MLKKVSNGALWAGVLTGAITQVTDTIAYLKGKLKKEDYLLNTAENVTSAIGVIAGIEYGAILGTTILPGVGTAVGSVLGGFVGDRVGRYVGQKTGKIVYQPIIKVNAKQVSVNNYVETPDEMEK